MSTEERKPLLEESHKQRSEPAPPSAVQHGRVEEEPHASHQTIVLPETDQDEECESGKPREEEVEENECTGFLFAFMTGICFTSCNVMVKFLPHISSWQLLFVRCTLQIISMLPFILVNKYHILGTPDLPTRIRVLLRGLLGGLLLLGLFQGVKSLPLGDATAIFFSCPAFTLILSTCILRDHCGLFRTFIAVALLSGVVILCRPPSIFPASDAANSNQTKPNADEDQEAEQKGFDLLGVGAAISVPIVASVIVIITRQAKHVHFSVLIIWFAVGGIITAALGLLFLDSQSSPIFQNWSPTDWILTFSLGTVGVLGNICMVKALQYADPSRVMVVRSFEVVVAYILQVTLFGVSAHPSDFVGALLIITAVLGMGMEQRLLTRFTCRFL